MNMDTRLQGQTMRVEDLLKLKEGNVLAFDYPLDRSLDLLINGKVKFKGQVVTTGRKRAFTIDQLHNPAE
jgi:flagellar motor switch/type III secretory pathway protein FliN